jgi:hypothetical protein
MHHLQRSPTPSDSTASWESAQSSHIEQETERLPSVIETAEPLTAQTPQKQAEKPVAHMSKPANPVAHLSNTATPLKTKSSMSSLLAGFTARTPKNRTPMKPSGQEMHPALHHASTAKVLDEARWLGFQALGAHTAPPKASASALLGAATPTKTTPAPASAAKLISLASPEFKFRFKSPVAGLSPASNRILRDGEEEDAVAGGRTLFGADEFSAPADISPRKFAVPKGKATRFSDVHVAQFKKMDSIANHPSAFRADLNRWRPAGKELKRSPSKAELDKEEPTTKTPNKLKRTQSKMDLTEPADKPSAPKTVTTPLKRAQSKTDVTRSNSKLPRSQSGVKMGPPSRDSRPQIQHGTAAAKRVKRTETDDAATTRPVSRDGPSDTGTNGPLHSNTALPLPTSRLMTPTKSSIARSQTVKSLKSVSMVPSMLNSPLAKALFSPTNIGETMKEGVKEGLRKTSSSLHRVRSILRTPGRKYSDDPKKIAAGTHMSPPPEVVLEQSFPKAPVTAPVRKHVNFTTSTLERAAQDELGKSPSPMKFRAGSEIPSGAVIYPKLSSQVEYPALPEELESHMGSPSRRLTFGGATSNSPAVFSFKADKSIDFGPVSTGTIRVVRKSDASSLVDGKKRKLQSVEETSDKENSEPAENNDRSAKKIKTSAMEPPKTPSASSKLPRRTPKHGSAISKSRLAFLATPKRPNA